MPRRTCTLLLGAASATGFALLAVAVAAGWSPLRHLDVHLDRALHADLAGHRTAVDVLAAVSDVGSPGASLAVLALAVLWLVVRRRRAGLAAVLVAGSLAATGLERLVKYAVARSRPAFAHPLGHAAGYAFPSGHAVSSLVDYGLVLLLLLPVLVGRARIPVAATAALWVAAVGFSRLGLGVHYLTDVIGGWLLGAVVLAVVALVVRRQP